MPTILTVPAGTTELHDLGMTYRPGADGTITVPDARVSAFQRQGCTLAVRPGASTTARRPTAGLAPGYMHFDTTLNKPIWRNAANTGWVDATGAGV